MPGASLSKHVYGRSRRSLAFVVLRKVVRAYAVRPSLRIARRKTEADISFSGNWCKDCVVCHLVRICNRIAICACPLFSGDLNVFSKMKNTNNSRLNGWPDLLLLWTVLMGACRFCSAGIACLSNPCIFGVCIDDLHRLVIRRVHPLDNFTNSVRMLLLASEYSCFCIDGYTGHHCQTNWDECWSMPCKNGGQCFDGVAQYNCSCLGGFTGNKIRTIRTTKTRNAINLQAKIAM